MAASDTTASPTIPTRPTRVGVAEVGLGVEEELSMLELLCVVLEDRDVEVGVEVGGRPLCSHGEAMPEASGEVLLCHQLSP